jgi:hypothetical protein
MAVDDIYDEKKNMEEKVMMMCGNRVLGGGCEDRGQPP